MNLNAIRNFEFTGYTSELEDINQDHSHQIRREPNVTYVDKFAESMIFDLYPEYHRQFIHGSRSYYNVERHMEALRNYGTPNIPETRLNRPLYDQSSVAVYNGLSSLPRVKAFDVLTELNLVKYNSSSPAGYNYQGVKGLPNGENHKTAIRQARALIGDIVDNGVPQLAQAITGMVPDVGYTSTQLTDLVEKTKVRSVWGRAFHYILIEGTAANPLIEMFMRHRTFYYIGRDLLDNIPDTISDAASKGRWLYAIDWKQFDARVSRFEINAAFDIIKRLIDFPNVDTEIAFELSRQLFMHKKIAAPDGKIYWSHKGIPSSSYYTSIIGSIVNRIRIEYLWRSITGRGPTVCYTQGDDSLTSDDTFIPPGRFAEVADQVGWFFNPYKTEYSTIPSEVSFLGRTLLGGQNIRLLKICIRLLVFPEFPVESGRISSYRASFISEDAGRISAVLNNIARRLERQYGMAEEAEVPDYFKRYIIQTHCNIFL